MADIAPFCNTCEHACQTAVSHLTDHIGDKYEAVVIEVQALDERHSDAVVSRIAADLVTQTSNELRQVFRLRPCYAGSSGQTCSTENMHCIQSPPRGVACRNLIVARNDSLVLFHSTVSHGLVNREP
jgi:hypothetical protein